ncbi:hypothetical protein MPSEU_000371600 [Mayamaea pseudoterrestris]|nr:hypothetical protein MPSEU_000371600 [Mayamaea pseudoterrestris]
MLFRISESLLLLSLLVNKSAGFVALPVQQGRCNAAQARSDQQPFVTFSTQVFNQHYNHEDSEEQNELVDDASQDWRAFRAKLINSEPEIYKEGTSLSERDTPNRDAEQIFHDWRSFRAKLVRSEPQMYKEDGLDEDIYDDCDPATGDCDLDGIGEAFFEDIAMKAALRNMMESSTHAASPTTVETTPLTQWDASQWAYESGTIIEQGTVVLGGVEQEFGFALRQQYFHKAAILVIDHQETTFTKGIILNRPTDFILEDDLNPGARWKLWFGGDVQGIESENPDLICLHTLTSPHATRASIPIMNDMQWTTFENAKRLVNAGVAQPQDFQVFCGYAGWGPTQLRNELDRKSWFMVATDSQTLIKELSLNASSDPRDAGLETWSMLMRMIGRETMATQKQDCFDDLMLKEWSLRHLLSVDSGGNAGQRMRNVSRARASVPRSSDISISIKEEYLRKDPVEEMMARASAAAQGQGVMPGHLVRASPVGRSPFLLDDQELHKSVILILSDDEKLTVGAILNRPAAKGVDIQISRHSSGRVETITIPLRFGGQYSVKGDEPLLWVHCNANLRAAGVGEPVGSADTGIWKCTADDVAIAIRQGLALVEDFFVVTGVSVWTKENSAERNGMQGEIESGRFELIPPSRTRAVWDSMSQQEVLTSSNVKDNLAVADEAWSQGIVNTYNPLPGIQDLTGNVSQEDTFVFKSNVKVSKLADDALENWVATFLLGVPSLN